MTAGAGARLAVERLTTLEDLHALREEWQALSAAAAPTSVFSSWTWVVSWFEHFRPRGQLLVLIVRDPDGRLVGIAPCSFSAPSPVGPRVLYLLGSGHALTEYVDAVLHREWADEAARAVVGALLAACAEWHLLGLPAVPGDSPLLRHAQELALARGCRVFVDEYTRAVRPLPDSWPEFYRSLRKSMKDNVNNYVNRLRREGREDTFVLVEDPAQLDGALDVFLDLHRRRSRARGRFEHHDKFATAPSRAFLRTVVRRLGAGGGVWVCLLEVDGRPVAAQICLVDGGRLYAYYSGHDPEWWQYGVMLVLTRRCIEAAIARGLTELDLLAGAYQDKLRWGARPEPLVDVAIAHRGLGSRLAFGLFRRYKRGYRTLGTARVLDPAVTPAP
jgi:CelD/BcsL family acetyltransferase involved in cellulose biosynthesis